MDLVWDSFCTSGPHIQGLTPSLFSFGCCRRCSRLRYTAFAAVTAVCCSPRLPLAACMYRSPPFPLGVFFTDYRFYRFTTFPLLPLTACRLTSFMFLSLTSVTAYRFCRVTFSAFTAYRSYLLSLTSFSAYLVYRLPRLSLTTSAVLPFTAFTAYSFHRLASARINFTACHVHPLTAYRLPLTSFPFTA